MTDKEFYELEKESEKEFKEFKKQFKIKFPFLYSAIKQHEKENNEKDILFVDLFCSKFYNEVLK